MEGNWRDAYNKLSLKDRSKVDCRVKKAKARRRRFRFIIGLLLEWSIIFAMTFGTVSLLALEDNFESNITIASVCGAYIVIIAIISEHYGSKRRNRSGI